MFSLRFGVVIALLAGLCVGCVQCDRNVKGPDASCRMATATGQFKGTAAEPRDSRNVYEASECIRRGDMGMANGDELEAIFWYKEAVKRGSALGRLKEKVASRALADAVAEPSPSSIDCAICRAACTMKCSGKSAQVKERLLARYAKEPEFSIAEAQKLSHGECHLFACELAVIGNYSGIAYLNSRKLIDVNDTAQGGMLHHASVAGDVAMVKWLVCVCGAIPTKVDDVGKTPQDWVVEGLTNCQECRRKDLEAVLVSLRDLAKRE